MRSNALTQKKFSKPQSAVNT